MKKISFAIKSKVWAFAAFLLLLGPAKAQTTFDSEKIENEATNIKEQAYSALKQETGISDAEVMDFFRYYQDTISSCMIKLTHNLQISSAGNSYQEQVYVADMKARFIQLYNTFKQIRAEFPSSVAEALTHQKWHNPTGVCNPACDNIDFSNGDLSAWTCGFGSCAAENGAPCSNGPPPKGSFIITGITYQTPGAGITKSAGPDASTGNDYQVYLETGGTDAITGIPKVCPGYTYSAMVGDSSGKGGGQPNQGVAMLEQTFQVTTANADFFYNYAVILNNPSHCYYQQPYFSVVMLDQNGDTIPHCGNYNVVAGGSNISSSSSWQYLNKGSGTEVDYLNWTTAFVSLKAYIGQCITVEVITSDCGQGGHYGYAYFVAKCKQLGIITSAPAVCGKPITLTAPTGGVSYQWIGPAGCMTPASGAAQTITVSCPGKYSVIIQTVAGAACADTLDTLITGAVGTPPVPNFKSDTACVGNPTQFINLTSGGSAANTYMWTFQGGDTTSVKNPQYTFPSAGTFTVMLQALNGGCGGDTTLSVVVNSPPVAGFTAPTVCQNSPTGFTNTSTNVTPSTAYKWIFGDGATSTAASPSHTYAACGTYNVILVAGTAPCLDSAKSTVTVNPNPKPAFTANPVCLGNNTVFTDTTKMNCGGTEASWSWMFGDPGSGASNTSAAQDPTHVFADTGCYSVFFKITTNLGCKDSVTRPVCIVGPPVPKFTATTVCVGKTTVFTNLSAPKPANSTWYFGDPLNTQSTLANPSFTYTAAGTYTVKLIVSSGAGCIDSITAPVTVNPLPTSGFTADTVCQGVATAFKDTSHGGATYSWNFGDGKGTSTAQSPTYTYAAAGTYKVSELVVTAAGCRDSITLSVLVNPNPTATITVPPVCLGTASVFTLTPTNMTGGTYAWTMGDGVGTSTAQSPTYTYAANGAYTASVNLTTINGCVGTATAVAIVNPIPVPNFSAPPVCLGKATSFNGNLSTLANIPPPQTIKSYVWAFGDGSTATGSTPTHPYTTCGAYSATLVTTSAAGCVHDTTIEDTVHPVPIPSFSATSVCQGLSNTFTDKSTIGCGGTIVSWAWNFGDGSAASTLQNPTHQYKTAGVYNVSLTVTSNKTPGCDSTITLPVIVYPIPAPAFTATDPCFGIATSFTNNSTVTGGSITGSAWRFGDPASGTSSATNPTFSYPSAGTYNVTLTVTSNFGCVDSITQPVTVNPIPVPGFYSDTAGCVTYCVSFTDTSSVVQNPAPQNIISYEWNFGDGSSDSSSTLAAPKHCFTKVGTFSIQLTVTTNHGCSATLTRPNYITTWPVPVAAFTASPNPTDTLSPTVIYTDNSTGNPVWWQWTFGDRTDSTEYTPNGVHTFLYTYTWQDTGTYVAKLVIKNKFGCTDSVTEPVVITPFWTFYVPNAFTPNGDGLNDGFIPKAVGVIAFQMWIFDRWGQELYHCTSLTQPWDGTVHTGPTSGQACQEDTYVWLIEFTDIYKNTHRMVGRVTIIK